MQQARSCRTSFKTHKISFECLHWKEFGASQLRDSTELMHTRKWRAGSPTKITFQQLSASDCMIACLKMSQLLTAGYAIVYICVYIWCFSIISINIYWRYAIVNVSSYAIRSISCWKVDALPFLLPNQRTQESAKWRTKDVKAQSVLRLAQDILKLHNETQINRDLTPDEEKRYMVCGWIKTNGSCYMWHNRLLFLAWGFWMRWKRTTTIFAFVSDQALVVFWNKYV